MSTTQPAQITLSVGPRNAFSEGGLRFYQWMGENYPSVTTLRRMAGMPFGLHMWTLGKTVDRAIDEYDELGVMLRNAKTAADPEAAVKAVKAWLRAASTEERDAAANLGTRVHDAATSGKTLISPDVKPFVTQYQDWLVKSRFKVLYTERQCWNLKLGYAGTFDILGELPSGEIVVVDLKTGKNTYTEHAIQLMAYAFGEHVGEDDVIDQAATKALLAASGVAILHLRPDGWKWQRVRVTPELFTAFKGLLDFAKFAHAHPKIDDLLIAERSGHA